MKFRYLPGAALPWPATARQRLHGHLSTATPELVVMEVEFDTAAQLLGHLHRGTPIELRTTMQGSYAPHQVRWLRQDPDDGQLVAFDRFWQGGRRYEQTLRFDRYLVTEITIHPSNHTFPEEMPPPS